MPEDHRLSRMETNWDLVRQAHAGSEGAQALHQLLARYRAPVQNYLLAAVGEADAAEELLQEFAVRFMRGDFHRADPTRGRFRNYLKGAVINLVANHHRKKKGLARQVPLPDDVSGDSDARLEQSLLLTAQQQILDRAWAALLKHERDRGVPYCKVLRLCTEQPELTSAQIASTLTAQLLPDKPYQEAMIRKTLQRARERFAGFVIHEILLSIPVASAEALQEELADLGLLAHCQDYLAGWLAKNGLER